METLRERLLRFMTKRQNSNVETPTSSIEDIFGRKEHTEDELKYGVMRQGYSGKQRFDALLDIYDPLVVGKIKKLDKFIKSSLKRGPKTTTETAEQGKQFLRQLNEMQRRIRKMKAENKYLEDMKEEALEQVGLKNRAIVEQLLKKLKN
jgi:predicted nuclease with TOPRIM domain